MLKICAGFVKRAA